jgi:hypothetical protein
LKISKLKLIAQNKKTPKKKVEWGNASKYHLTKPLSSFAWTSEAAVVVANPSVDSTSPPSPNCLEILRMKIKNENKRRNVRV